MAVETEEDFGQAGRIQSWGTAAWGFKPDMASLTRESKAHCLRIEQQLRDEQISLAEAKILVSRLERVSKSPSPGGRDRDRSPRRVDGEELNERAEDPPLQAN